MIPEAPVPPADVRAALELARRAGGPDEAALDAGILLAHLLKLPRAAVLAHPEIRLPDTVAQRFLGWMERCAAGEPLAYLTGEREFFGLPFFVSPDVLVPRPETELLVERAVDFLKARRAESAGPLRVVDVGTGSGCIAVSIATRVSGVAVTAADLSRAALAVAARNAARHGLTPGITLLQADLLAALSGPFDLICANLPYIPTSTLDGLAVARFEPRLALDGGPDGLALIRRLLAQCATRLAPRGMALLEIEATQADAVVPLVHASLPGARASVEKDLAGRDRLIAVELTQ